MSEAPGNAGKKRTGATTRREVLTAVVLILCVGLVAFWQAMAAWSVGPREAFELDSAHFAGFKPRPESWDSREVPVPEGDIEPNILAYELTPNPRSAASALPVPVLVRLVHGYNMPDCMRLKGYEAALIADTRGTNDAPRTTGPAAAALRSALLELAPRRQVQVWTLTSDIGDVSVWVTSMLRSDDFSESGVDVRAMAFPRVGAVEDPGWSPEGVTVDGLRHPVRNLRRFLNAKWNNARRDLLTFLRLRRPAWASAELLTLVSSYRGRIASPDRLAIASAHVLQAHLAVHSELKAWAQVTGEPPAARQGCPSAGRTGVRHSPFSVAGVEE